MSFNFVLGKTIGTDPQYQWVLIMRTCGSVPINSSRLVKDPEFSQLILAKASSRFLCNPG